MLFYPFINEELDNIEVEIRLKKFLEALEKEINKKPPANPKQTIAPANPKQTIAPANIGATPADMKGGPLVSDMKGGPLVSDMKGGGIQTKQQCNDKCKNSLREINDQFKKVFKTYKDKFPYDKDGQPRGGTTNVRAKLYEVMNNQGLFKKGKEDAEKAAKGNSHGDVDNIYLDFFIAATKPPEHLRMTTAQSNNGETPTGAKHKAGRFTQFMNPFGGDTRYWMRYIVTWFLPIIAMILLMVSVFTGFWFTAFSSVNRYSNIILPLIGGIWVSLLNMFAQPASVFFYMIFGVMGKNSSSKKCPYDSGGYQMKKNMKQYFGLNLFITLAIIITSLGSTMVASGKGPKAAGVILSLLFPVYAAICLALKLFYFLWYLV